jgi:hypothetical protein
MGKIKILAGDFRSGIAYSTKNTVNLKTAAHPVFGEEIDLRGDVERLEILTSENSASALKTLGFSAGGMLLAGLPGLAAGAVAGARGKRITAAAVLRDGRRFLCTATPAMIETMQASVFDPPLAAPQKKSPPQNPWKRRFYFSLAATPISLTLINLHPAFALLFYASLASAWVSAWAWLAVGIRLRREAHI